MANDTTFADYEYVLGYKRNTNPALTSSINLTGKWDVHRNDKCPYCAAKLETGYSEPLGHMVEGGYKPFTMLAVCLQCYGAVCEYESGTLILWPLSRIIETDQETTEETKTGKEKTMKKDQLFEIKVNNAETKFGTKIGQRSNGDWVMEIKGSGEVITTAKDKIEKVMPYTVDIEYLNNRNRAYAFFAKEGQFSVDDLVYAEDYGNFVKVVAVDTKAEQATKPLNGWKVSAHYINNDE